MFSHQPAATSSTPPTRLAGIITFNHTEPINASQTVYKGTHLAFGKVALRRPRTARSDVASEFLRAVEVRQSLEHKHVLNYLGTYLDGSTWYLVSNWAENKTLLDYIQRHPAADRPQLLHQVADALHYLHDMGVTHGDVRARNVLVSVDGNALLHGFGNANPSPPSSPKSSTILENIRWQSPELIEGGPISREADVYAFGITVYEVLSGKRPFSSLDDNLAVREAVLSDQRPQKLPTSSTTGQVYSPLWDLAERCWHRDPDQRLVMREVFHSLTSVVVHVERPSATPQRVAIQDTDPLVPPSQSRPTGSFNRLKKFIPRHRATTSLTQAPAPPSSPSSAKARSLLSNPHNSRGILSVLMGGKSRKSTGMSTTPSAVDAAGFHVGIPRYNVRYEASRTNIFNFSGKSKSLEEDTIILDDQIPTNILGASSNIHRGTDSEGRKIALKSPRNPATQEQEFREEAEIWRQLNHKHVLQFFGVGMDTNGLFYLLSPWIDYGSLLDHIKKYPKCDRPKLLRDAADALVYLHDRNVIHGDVKAGNILVTSDGNALLCDFGLSRLNSAGPSKEKEHDGTVRWQSPELWEGANKSFKSDVWAFGMTVYEVFSGKSPFASYEQVALFAVIVRKRERPPKDPETSPTGESYLYF